MASDVMAMVTIDDGMMVRRGLGTRVLEWLERVGQGSPGAKAARRYAALDAMSDAELARRGLARSDLAELCFEPHRWC